MSPPGGWSGSARPFSGICYAAGTGKDVASLVEVDYSADGRAAFVDWYDY